MHLTSCLASLAITTLVLYAAFPNELYYMYITKIIGKVYSNTLLVSFNNRIYFREHQLPEHGESAFLTVSGRVRATALSSFCFAVPEPQLRTSTLDNPQLCTIGQTVELDGGKGDDTSTDWSPSYPRMCHLLPDNPECMVDTLPPAHG
ncbi:hypothetical protein BJY52DRAFT_1353063 [Lactarius psammicola]|nr:hypothetical protein BJY52DRAFT_1353063 [Lactarius psammicola]